MPQAPSPNDIVLPTSTNDIVSFKLASFPPHMQSDAVSPPNDDGPRTLEGTRKKQHDVVLMLYPNIDPTRPTNQIGPKWKTTAHKSTLRAQAQKLKAQPSTSFDPLSDPDQEPSKVKGPSGPNPRSDPRSNPQSFIHLPRRDTWQEHKWADPPIPMSPYPVRKNHFSPQPVHPTRPIHLNRPNHHPFTNFDRSGALLSLFVVRVMRAEAHIHDIATC
jgi:hypothetical protein